MAQLMPMLISVLFEKSMCSSTSRAMFCFLFWIFYLLLIFHPLSPPVGKMCEDGKKYSPLCWQISINFFRGFISFQAPHSRIGHKASQGWGLGCISEESPCQPSAQGQGEAGILWTRHLPCPGTNRPSNGTYSFSYLEPVYCAMSSSNCCFLICI